MYEASRSEVVLEGEKSVTFRGVAQVVAHHLYFSRYILMICGKKVGGMMIS